MKTCTACNETKSFDQFWKDSRSQSYRSKCKDCTNTKRKAYLKTEAGRISAIRSTKKYQASERGQEVLAKYKKSEERQITISKHTRSAKYKQRSDAQYIKDKTNGKAQARRAVNNALAKGKMSKLPCEVCGSTKLIHGHHDDYSKPLDVKWLCPTHHYQRHQELRPNV